MRILHILTFLLILLICSNSITLNAQDRSATSLLNSSEEEDYTVALGFYQDSLFQLASQQFQDFITKYPNSIKRREAMFLAAECFFHTAQYQAAIFKYEEFIQAYPNSNLTIDAYIRLGRAYLAQKKYDEANSLFKIVLEKHNDNPKAGEAAYWLGEVFLQKDEMQNAIKYYTLSYENYPQSRVRDYALYSIAWTYQKRGDFKKASEWYSKLIAEYPESSLSASAYVRVGECLYHAKDYKQAILHVKNSRNKITNEEELGDADYLIAEAIYKTGDITEAQNQYKQFLVDHPNHKLAKQVRYLLGWSYLKQGNYTESINIFNSLSNETDEISQSAIYQRSVAERLMGQKDKALQTLHELYRSKPDGPWGDNSLFDIGLIYFEENNISKAKSFFERITKDYIDSDVLPDSYWMLGECLLTENKFNEAYNCFEKAKSSPNVSFDVKVAATFQAAFCSYKMNNFKDASSKFASFIQQYPNHPKSADAKYYQAEAEYKLGNYDLAGKLFQNAINSAHASKKEEILYGLAWTYYKQGQFQQSITYFKKLVAEYPKSKYAFDSRVRIGDAYFFLKDYKKAIESYRIVIRSYPDSSSIDYAYYQLGQSCHKDGNYTEAYKAFESLINVIPKSSLADEAQFAKGWLNFQRKEYSEAIKEFDKLIKAYPNSELVPRTYYSIGDCYYNLKEYDQAEKYYNTILKQYPQSNYVLDAITGIQYCLAAQGKNVDVMGIIDNFVKENPNQTSAKELELKKGELLFEQNKYAEAAQLFKAFIQNNINSKLVSNAQYFLGKCYRAQGKLDDAVIVFKQVIGKTDVSDKILSESTFETADILIKQNKPHEAIDLLQKLQERVKVPDVTVKSGVLKGQSYELQDNQKSAIEEYENVIQRFSDLPVTDEARIALARIYYKDKNYDKAIQISEIIVKNRKDELGAEAQYIIGTSFAQMKQWKEAIPALLRVKYLYPNQEKWLAKAYLNLGMAYEETNDLKRARESYQAISKLKTEAAVKNEAQKRIKELEQR